jgi:hypothetical protein
VFGAGDGWAIGVALGIAVAGIACVNEMKISGVVVGGSLNTGVSAAVGTSLVGAIFTDTSHAAVTRINTDRNKKSRFMVGFPFAYIIVSQTKRLPSHQGSLELVKWIGCSIGR